MATNGELEQRIEALENDYKLRAEKAESLANYWQKRTNDAEVLANRNGREVAKMRNERDQLIMLCEKHNALCDVLIKYGAVQDDQDGHAYEDALHSARIDTGDTEAQDDETREAVSRNVSEMGSPSKESQDAEGASKTVEEEDGGNKSREAEICGVDGRGEPNDNVATGDGNSSVDAIMGELRKVIPRALYENRVTMAESESDDVFYAEEWELPSDTISRRVRPHIERLVRERDALAVEIERKWRTERDKALAEVVRLRDLLKAMPHLGEAHEGYVQAVNEALAEGNDYG